MSDITPADLARFVHRVPDGATIPAGTEYAVLIEDGLYTLKAGADLRPGRYHCWTAEPIAAPKQSLADRARAVAMTARINSDVTLSNLALIVAELAETIEAER